VIPTIAPEIAEPATVTPIFTEFAATVLETLVAMFLAVSFIRSLPPSFKTSVPPSFTTTLAPMPVTAPIPQVATAIPTEITVSIARAS